MLKDLSIKCFSCGVNDFRHTIDILDTHILTCKNCGRVVEHDGSKMYVDGLIQTGYYEALVEFISGRKMTDEEFEELLGMI